ncbi:hypothetical protein [Enterococcus bulliens]
MKRLLTGLLFLFLGFMTSIESGIGYFCFTIFFFALGIYFLLKPEILKIITIITNKEKDRHIKVLKQKIIEKDDEIMILKQKIQELDELDF